MNQEDIKYLDEMKQKSLSELSEILPTVSDQPPETKFDMAMNLLQYGFDRKLVDMAHSAILEVENPEAKAELLSQLINEINFWKDNLAAPAPATDDKAPAAPPAP
jgi:hypothetical protein